MDGVQDFYRRGGWFFAALVGAFIIFSIGKQLLAPTPHIALSLANGAYVSSCCGTIVLHDGRLRSAGIDIPYRLSVIKTDLELEVDGDLFVERGSRINFQPGVQRMALSLWRYPHRSNMMNIYDARIEAPDRLTIWARGDSQGYHFVRTGQ